MSTAPRLTRKERQAQTRAALVEAAGRVFAEKGLHGASIDDIAAHAGFTKGAFYANFASKEELFLEMLDVRYAERLEEIEAVTAGHADIREQAERVGREFAAALRGDADWARLFLEFSAHATRNETFRAALIARTDALRGAVAAILERRAAEAGIVPAFPADEIARMTFAMAHGVAIEQLLDDRTPDDLFGVMLRLFFTGLAVPTPPA